MLKAKLPRRLTKVHLLPCHALWLLSPAAHEETYGHIHSAASRHTCIVAQLHSSDVTYAMHAVHDTIICWHNGGFLASASAHVGFTCDRCVRRHHDDRRCTPGDRLDDGCHDALRWRHIRGHHECGRSQRQLRYDADNHPRRGRSKHRRLKLCWRQRLAWYGAWRLKRNLPQTAQCMTVDRPMLLKVCQSLVGADGAEMCHGPIAIAWQSCATPLTCASVLPLQRTDEAHCDQRARCFRQLRQNV